jgi:membrane-associated phospholipid phosphatase
MINMDAATHARWDAIADCINPLLGVVLIGAAFFVLRRHAWLFLLRAWLAVGLVFVLAHLPRWLHLFGERKFPSGHMAFAACVATSLILLNRRWAIALLPLLVAYGVLMMALGFHDALDLGAAVVLAVPLTLWCQRPMLVKNRAQDQTKTAQLNET